VHLKFTHPIFNRLNRRTSLNLKQSAIAAIFRRDCCIDCTHTSFARIITSAECCARSMKRKINDREEGCACCVIHKWNKIETIQTIQTFNVIKETIVDMRLPIDRTKSYYVTS